MPTLLNRLDTRADELLRAGYPQSGAYRVLLAEYPHVDADTLASRVVVAAIAAVPTRTLLDR